MGFAIQYPPEVLWALQQEPEEFLYEKRKFSTPRRQLMFRFLLSQAEHIIRPRRGLLPLGGLLLVGCFGAQQEAPPAHDIAREVFASGQTLLDFTDAKSVTAQRMHVRRDADDLRKLGGYQVGEPVSVGAEDARKLQRLFVQDSSYGWDFAKPCEPIYGVLLTFRAEQSAVRVALCFECQTFGIYDSSDDSADRINLEDDFDPIRGPLLSIVKSVFPNDATIQALE